MALWKYFLIGLGVGILGAILWVLSSVTGGAIEGLGGERHSALRVLMYIGFMTMIFGPFTFWIILPIRRAVKRRRPRE